MKLLFLPLLLLFFSSVSEAESPSKFRCYHYYFLGSEYQTANIHPKDFSCEYDDISGSTYCKYSKEIPNLGSYKIHVGYRSDAPFTGLEDRINGYIFFSPAENSKLNMATEIEKGRGFLHSWVDGEKKILSINCFK